MSLSKIHSLSFDWSSSVPSGIQFTEYVIHVMVNDLFLEKSVASSTTTSFTINELIEGDSVFLEIVPSNDGALFNQNIITTATQHVPVTNFNNNGSSFVFDTFNLNGVSRAFELNDDGKYYASGEYTQQLVSFKLKVLSPRDNEPISSSPEPFWSHNAVSLSNDRGDTILSIDEFSTFYYSTRNTYNSRDLQLDFVSHDVYGGTVTGIVNAHKATPHIISETFSFTPSLDVETGRAYNLFVNPSHKISNFDYIFYENDDFTNPLISGTSSSQFSTIGFLPKNINTYLSIIPNDWFGSGIQYYKPDLISTVEQVSITPNTLDDVSIEDWQTGIFFQPNVTQNNDVGSYIYYSIDSSNSSSYNTYSYKTGVIEPNEGLYSSFYFHSFFSRTGTHEDFFYTVKLQRSGSNFIEGMETGFFSCPYPRFSNTSINFDNIEGMTTIIADSNYAIDPSNPTVDVYYRSDPSSPYTLNNDHIITYGQVNHYAEFELRNSNDNSIVYDTAIVTGSPLRPTLGTEPILSPSVEGSVNVTVKRISDTPVIDYAVYRKPAIKTIDGQLPDNLSGIIKFDDYLYYYYESGIPIGNYYDMPPDSVPPRNSTVEYIDSQFSGQYETGKHYLYRFVPYDGYGSGNASEPVLLTFSTNVLAQSTTNEVGSTTERVGEVESALETGFDLLDVLRTGYAYLTGVVVALDEQYDHIHDHVEGLMNMETGISYLMSGYHYLTTGSIHQLQTGYEAMTGQIYALQTGNNYLISQPAPVVETTMYPSFLNFGLTNDIVSSLEADAEALWGPDYIDGYVMPTSGYVASISAQYFVDSVGSSNEKNNLMVGINYAGSTGILSRALGAADDQSYIQDSVDTYIPFSKNDILNGYVYVDDTDVGISEIALTYRIYTP